MFIKSLTVKNYRTLEDISIEFNNYYTAICGKNNVGKSNIIRAIRNMLSSGIYFRFLPEEIFGFGDLVYEDNITKWKANSNEDIYIKLLIEINKDEDSSLFMFIMKIILKDNTNNESQQKEVLSIEYHKKKRTSNYNIKFGNIVIEDELSIKEILRRIKTSDCIIFHNSTENDNFPPIRNSFNSISNFLTEKEKKSIYDNTEKYLKPIQKALKKQEDELSKLLGRLEETYEVSFSLQKLRLERESVDISLKEKGENVSLDEWGSGTKNRTKIFMSLLSAKKMQLNTEFSDKIYPILLIEEPESFLHPSAQAEFGRILQDISNEFRIQVIVTTHSPYLLNHKNHLANILVNRDLKRNAKIKGSTIVNTAMENWYEPFAIALGINGEDFGPIKSIIFNESNNVVLVEGEIDVKYLELLKDPKHGNNALIRAIELLPYNGCTNLRNNFICSFIKNRFTKSVIIVDLDAINQIKQSVAAAGYIEGKNFITIGLLESGKKSIEGLVPASIKSKVNANNPDLIDLLHCNEAEEKKEAKLQLKILYLEEFKRSATIENGDYEEFYKLVKKINSNFK